MFLECVNCLFALELVVYGHFWVPVLPPTPHSPIPISTLHGLKGLSSKRKLTAELGVRIPILKSFG